MNHSLVSESKNDRPHAHDHDHDHAHGHENGQVQSRDACCSPSPAAPRGLRIQETVAGGTRTAIRIMQMDCPTEETLIRNKLIGMQSVKSIDFNLMQRVITVVHTPGALDSILHAVRTLGFKPEPADTGESSATVAEPAKPWWPLAIAGAAAVASEAVTWMGQPAWLAATLAVLAVAACGLTTYKKGWVAIRNGNLNINALMSIAVTGALVLRQWPEAAMVMVLFTMAELIEAKSLDRARNAIKGLMQLAPDKAAVQQSDGSWQEVEVKSIAVDALVRVKPGERIGLDGKIVTGRTTVDQAPITGESLPVDKTQGDSVFAGTINGAGSFDYRVGAAANNTTLARIIHVVEEAQGS